MLLGSWRTRRVSTLAQPQSKLHEPRELSAKGSSFCTKNTDIVCRQPRAALQGAGWLGRSLQQLGPKSLRCLPGWGLQGTAAGGGQPSCMPAPSPSVDIAMGWRRAAFRLPPPPLQQEGWDQASPTQTVGINPPICPRPQPHHPNLAPSLWDATNLRATFELARQPADLPKALLGPPNPRHHQTTDKPQQHWIKPL